MPTSHIVQLFLVLGVLVCLFAFWKGGRAERLGAFFIFGNLVLTMVVATVLPPGARQVGQLCLDAATALGLLAIVLGYGSLWLGGAMLLYAAQFTLHSFYFVTERPKDNLHAIINNLNFAGVMWCLAIGTIVVWRRRMRDAAVSA